MTVHMWIRLFVFWIWNAQRCLGEVGVKIDLAGVIYLVFFLAIPANVDKFKRFLYLIKPVT